MVKTRENTDTQVAQYRRIHLSTCLHCYFATQWDFFPVSVSDWWPALDSGGTISISPTDELPWHGRTLTQSGSRVATMYHHVYGPTTIPWFKLIQVALETLAAQAPMLINATPSWNSRKKKNEKWIHRIGDLDDVCFVAGSYWEMMFLFQVLFRFRGFQRAKLLECCEEKGSSVQWTIKCVYIYIYISNIICVCVWNSVVHVGMWIRMVLKTVIKMIFKSSLVINKPVDHDGWFVYSSWFCSVNLLNDSRLNLYISTVHLDLSSTSSNHDFNTTESMVGSAQAANANLKYNPWANPASMM